MKAILTDHAKIRLDERTSLSAQEFSAILDRDSAVSAGFEPETTRWHRVFYSLSDEQHFVAIQDIANGEVITVLPLDYHKNIAWKISSKTRKLAKARAIWDAAQQTPKPRFEMTGVFWDNAQTVKRRLGIFRFEAFPVTPEEVLENHCLIATIIEKLRARDLSQSTLEEVLLFERESCTFFKLSSERIEEFSAFTSDDLTSNG